MLVTEYTHSCPVSDHDLWSLGSFGAQSRNLLERVMALGVQQILLVMVLHNGLTFRYVLSTVWYTHEELCQAYLVG